MKKPPEKFSILNVILLLLIALGILGAVCFINFAYQATVSIKAETSQTTVTEED